MVCHYLLSLTLCISQANTFALISLWVTHLPLLLLFISSLRPIHFLAGQRFNCLGL